MSQNRGFENKQAQGREKAVTVTESGNKVGIDVSIVSAGSSGLESGSLLGGLTYKAVTVSRDATSDTYSYYSDALKTDLVTTIVITFTDAEKCDISEVIRTDA